MKHDVRYKRFSLLKAYKIVRCCPIKGFKHPAKSMSSKRSLTYNKLSTLLKDLKYPIKTTLLRDLIDSPVKMSQQ